MKIFKLKVTSIRGSLGVVLPDTFLRELKLVKGDSVSAIETCDGLLLMPHDAEVEKQVRLGLEFMAKHRDIFRALADGERS
jgi:antitoxin component of MazEF toxin-antitoxin module